MATHMVQASFTLDAWANPCRHPQDRSAVGGKLLSYYYCFGDHDVAISTEEPNDTTIMAAMVSSISAGHIKSTKTTKLMTSDEAMTAMADAGKATFVPPSG